MTIALETIALTKQFGGLTAVDSVDLAIEEHSIFSVIGPNGAGKTTFYNCITGFYTPETAMSCFMGNRWSVWPPTRSRTRVSRVRTRIFACLPT